MDKIKLLRDCALIKLTPSKKSGIELPEDVKARQKMEATHGTVVATGPECEVVQAGDRVLYREYVGHVIEDDLIPKDGDHVIVSENDILISFREGVIN